VSDAESREALLALPYGDKLEMVRPSSRLVTVADSPEGYRLRTLEAGEEKLYESLFASAFDDGSRIAEIPDKMLPGGCLVVEHRDSRKLVASCLAFRGTKPPRHHNAGQLAWLVVHPLHGKQGLGTIAAASVTNRLVQEGYTRPFLRTEDFRIPAISIYLRLGWRPSLYTAEMHGRWECILAAISEPRANAPTGSSAA
jgi:mycothiol synthase